VCDNEDTCPLDGENDADSDSLCGNADPCPTSAIGDSDGDGICDNVDSCPQDANNDADQDGICNSEDPCPQDSTDGCTSSDQSLVDEGNATALLDEETTIIVVAVVCSAVVVALTIVVVVVVVNKNKRASTKRVYEVPVSRYGTYGATYGAEGEVTPSPRRIQDEFSPVNSKASPPWSSGAEAPERAASVVSTTEGREAKPARSARHKTKPTNGKARKSRKTRKSSGSRKSTGTRGTADGDEDKWTPDPHRLSKFDFEKSLLKFFKKHNEAKVPMVAKMAKIYNAKRNRLYSKLFKAYKAAPGGARIAY